MTGALLNLIAIGNQNIILTGNPTKSFFKTKYAKYTNFGLQKDIVEPVGQTELDIQFPTKYRFKIPRYGDLLMDTYLVITLPKIWSPVYKYTQNDLKPEQSVQSGLPEYRPYEFQWIKNIGTQIIEEVQYSIGGRLIQKYSGSYIQNIVERDYDANKKELFNIMTGNTKELTDPANYSNRNNNYPNAFRIGTGTDISSIEPSIPETQLFIPINSWYSMMSTMALPLVCLQYAELEIEFILKPLQSLYTVKEVLYNFVDNKLKIGSYDDFPRIRPEITSDPKSTYGLYRFIQEPPKRDIDSNYTYENQLNKINSKIHLITTQCFLDNEERIYFANNTQEYLIKIVYEYRENIKNQSGKFKIDSLGLVSSWMWYFQRDDVKDRNEWSNYTNWPYENKFPNTLKKITDTESVSDIYYPYLSNYVLNDLSKNIYYTGYVPETNMQQNYKEILKNFSIIVDGKDREKELPSGVFSKIENYRASSGILKDGLYNYNFSLHTDPYRIQPSGAFNTNKFKRIEFEYNLTSNPPFDLSSVHFSTICDPETGEIIATSKDPGSIYKYNYILHIYEERYNILKFQSGTADLEYSR